MAMILTLGTTLSDFHDHLDPVNIRHYNIGQDQIS
jgi:hypothetical protein